MTTPEAEPGTTPAHVTPTPPRRKNRRLLRYFLLQLFPVTAGILIALLIDGALELRREDQLVAEAHASIAAEIADNAKDLDNALPTFDTSVAALDEMLKAVDAILANGVATPVVARFGVNLPALNRTSWDSAERTGALGYMDFVQVKAYSDLYAVQDMVLASQNELSRRFPSLGPIGQSLNSENAAARPEDLYRSRASLAELLVALGTHRFTAERLRGEYRRIPCYSDECPQSVPAP